MFSSWNQVEINEASQQRKTLKKCVDDTVLVGQGQHSEQPLIKQQDEIQCKGVHLKRNQNHNCMKKFMCLKSCVKQISQILVNCSE